jgi:hypothetical protein
MDSSIVGALTFAVTTLLIVLFKRARQRSADSEESGIWLSSPQPGSVDTRKLERSLRADARIQKMLGDQRRQAATEAAIAYLVHERECPVESWRDTSTWEQVETVLNELKRRDAQD